MIAYFSCQRSRQECATRRELLAITQVTKHFHHYLYGREFTVQTDHAALKWLLSFKHPKGHFPLVGTLAGILILCPGDPVSQTLANVVLNKQLRRRSRWIQKCVVYLRLLLIGRPLHSGATKIGTAGRY